MSEKKSDLPAASVGFFGGMLLLAAILFGISRMTTSKYSGEKEPAAAEHKAP